MKNKVKELTEGMQRLCSAANRVVAAEGKVSTIERDLLLDDLRRLYDVALSLGEEDDEEQENRNDVHRLCQGWDVKMPDDDMLSSTVMATMAAMGVDHREETPAEEAGNVAADEAEPQPEEPAEEMETAAEETKPDEPEVEQPAEKEPEATVETEPTLDLSPETVIVPEPEPEGEATKAAPSFMEAVEPAMGTLLFDEVIIEPEPAPATPTPEPKEEEPLPSPEPEPAVATEQPAAPAEEEPEPEPVKEHQPVAAQASLLDYLKHPVEEHPTVRTLGEKLGSGESGRVKADGGKHVTDLRTVININDKFSFMSELFHNNMRAYNDFILRLNSIEERDEALAYVQEVASQQSWDEESVAVQSFYKILDKKF